MALLITFLAGISIGVGALIVKYSKNPDLLSHLSLSLALGAMIVLVLFDLGPEAAELADEAGLGQTLLTVALGVALLALLEFFIPDHDGAASDTSPDGETSEAIHVGLMTVAALALHNIVEGMSIYALALNDLRGGAIYALGVALHNLPMGMLIFSALRHERKRVKALAFAGALFSTVLGGLVMMLVSPLVTQTTMELLTCLALGMILYIIVMELLPHVLRERPAWVGAAGTAVGFALVLASSLLG